MLSCEYCKIFKKTYFVEQLRANTSAFWRNNWKWYKKFYISLYKWSYKWTTTKECSNPTEARNIYNIYIHTYNIYTYNKDKDEFFLSKVIFRFVIYIYTHYTYIYTCMGRSFYAKGIFLTLYMCTSNSKSFFFIICHVLPCSITLSILYYTVSILELLLYLTCSSIIGTLKVH